MLAEHQRAMRDLLKGRAAAPEGDTYLAEVARSDGLALLREVALWWLKLDIEQHCESTARFLKRVDALQSCVERFYREERVASFGESGVERFLDWLRRDAREPLLLSLTGFDLALARLRRGEDGPFPIDWDRDPEAVFAALASDAALPAPGPAYRLHIGREFPGLVRCERVG
jgi:hypothetical protein